MSRRIVILLLTIAALCSVAFQIPPSGAVAPRHWTKDGRCKTEALRKEWGSLTKPERRAYIDAVLCLQNSPSKLAAGLVPGAKSRYDDFMATHINQTLSIHLSGIFLSWHREFIHLYEKALQQECGYKGAQPYWNWPLWASDLASSPLFDGSATSLSGDGAYDPTITGYPVGGGTLPRGTGGGCVLAGPFANHTVNMGPFDFALVFSGVLPANWTAYTPHCFLRDLDDAVAQTYVNQTAFDVLMAMPNITAFQGTMSGVGVTTQGVHGGSHFTIGLTLQNFFASPADPAFYFHHAQIDRLWTLWQAMDPAQRQYALNWSSTIFYAPTTPDVTLQTVENWGCLGRAKAIKELMVVGAGDYCYEYQ